MVKAGDRQRNWKGQTAKVVEPARHRWQVESTQATGDRFDAPVRTARRTLALFLVLSLGLLCTFVFLLLHAPIKTPVITVGATNYTWPLPPNAWAKEDVAGLASLHGKVIHHHDSSKEWQTKSSCLEDLTKQIQEFTPLAKRSGALILYLNMHGAVNEEGKACVIPPGASPTTTTQWLAIEEIGEVISRRAPEGVKVLLVLDCVHQRVNWNIAQLTNTFVERVEQWVADAKPKSLVVLTSSDADQQSWSGVELHHSIFGRELRLGLAGAADRSGDSQNIGSGNDDGSVSIRELGTYLAKSVDDWTRTHRTTSQSPRVFPTSFDDFHLGWSLKSGELNRQRAASTFSDVAVQSPSVEELTELWRQIHQLRSLGVYRYDPKGWADIEQRTLWLEQLATAGSAYTDLASKQIYPQLSKRLKEAAERATQLASTNNEFAKWNVLQERVDNTAIPSNLPSLALREYVNEVPSATAANIRRRILTSVDAGQNEPVGQWTASFGLSPDAVNWNELNFVALTQKYECNALWPDLTSVRDLLDLRDQCEQLAVFGDVRGHRWRRQALQSADLQRRSAEDQLFLGPPKILTFGGEQSSWPSLRKAMADVTNVSGTQSGSADAALWLRDRGLSEVFHLASWICSPDAEFDNLGEWLADGSKPSDTDVATQLLSREQNVDPFLREQLAIQQLKRLLNGLQEMTSLLSETTRDDKVSANKLQEIVLQVQHDMDSLHGLVNDHIDRSLRSPAEGSDAIRSIDSLLRIPFLTLEQRDTLRKKRDSQIQFGIRANAVTSNTSSDPFELGLGAIANRLGMKNETRSATNPNADKTELAKRSRYADRMRNWNSHPIGEQLAIQGGLSIESFAAQASASASDRERELQGIDVANSKLRQCYQSMLSFNTTRLDDWIQVSGVQQIVAPEATEWQRAAAAEHFERAMVTACPIRYDASATSTFRSLALKDLVIWYSQRTIDDFYADANGSNAGLLAGPSYFERSAQECLAYASRIPESSVILDDATRSVAERLKILGPIARNGIKTTVKLGPPEADSDRIAFDVALQPVVSMKDSTTSWQMPFPAGQASVLVRSARGIMKNDRIGVAMPLSDQTPSYNLYCPPFDRSLSHDAVAVFRGHEFSAPLYAGQGILVDYRPAKYDWADVVLFGDRQRQPSIMFVLDCSWSMGEELPVEAIGLKSQSRLEIAKESILRMLGQIASRPDARVGVRLFGSRLGWSRPVDEKTGISKGKSQILVQPNYPDTIPDDLVPSRDVDTLLPLGRFSTDMMGDMRKKLSKIVPWGQSPLYLSIIESFNDFSADDDSTAKSIVIITDGDNFQFNASGRPGGEPDSLTTLDGVYRAWSANKVPLFILGVGVTDPENASARETLQELAERTDGKYYDIENDNDLVRALSEQLAMGTYRVSRSGTAKPRASGRQSADSARETKLNNTTEVKPIVTGATYDVTFQSLLKSVQFEGGESIELYLTEDGRDIVGKPYDRSSPRAATLVRSGDSGRLIARVHRPTMHQDGVFFPVSVQDPDNHYTQRPKQLWIEVSPVIPNADLPRHTYLFYDANYEAKTPVPYVNWHASNWPVAATMADVRVWAKFEETPSLQEIPLNQLQQDPQRFADGIDVTGAEGVQLRINVFESRANSENMAIQVTELHSERSRGVGSIRVSIDMNDGGIPARVTHRYEAASRMAIHTFEFPAAQGRELLRSNLSTISIQSRSACHEGAWQLQAGQPIRVDVTSVPETLPLSGLPSSVSPVRR